MKDVDKTSQYSVLILGYGEMGHAMEYLLKDRHPLFIWEKFPEQGFQSVHLEKVVPESDIVLFCLPVNPHREVLNAIREGLKPGSTCLSIAKGLDEAGTTAAQIFQEALDPGAYALLYGPMIAEEIRAGRPAFAQLGCNNDTVFSAIRDLYNGSQLYLEQTADITGITWSVVLKNVYALVFGMADELRLGDNMRGFLAVAALRELDQIARLMGGAAGSPFHLAGLGDLITTATSENSHHHELGRKLARGDTENLTGEGLHTLQMVIEHQLFNINDYPLFRLIESVTQNPDRVETRLKTYLAEVFHP
jgi:glycerol-3-phosphate dehydrogenase (NAD(P)+)